MSEDEKKIEKTDKTLKMVKTSKYNNNKFKISAPTWNDTFDLPDGSYPISDIQYCF